MIISEVGIHILIMQISLIISMEMYNIHANKERSWPLDTHCRSMLGKLSVNIAISVGSL